MNILLNMQNVPEQGRYQLDSGTVWHVFSIDDLIYF